MEIFKTIINVLYNLEIKHTVKNINSRHGCILWNKTTDVQKIHFIYRVDKRNAGDMNCCPLFYFKSYFGQYNTVIHDIYQIHFDKILEDDIVVLGGGGMLYCDRIFQSNIIRLLNACKNVIAWGVGFNTHTGQRINEDIDFNRFKFISIRDYNHKSGLTYVPCPSVFRLDYSKTENMTPVRKIGIIEHHKFRISGFIYDKINNSYNIDRIIRFILQSEVIITNSYHIIYFCQLLGKKVICINKFSDKFDYFKYKPVFYSGNLEDDIPKIQPCGGFKEEAVKLNTEYFNKIMEFIESINLPKVEKMKCKYACVYNDICGSIKTAVKEIRRFIINSVYNKIYRKHGYNQISNFTEYDRYPGIFAYVNSLIRKKKSKVLSFGCSYDLECLSLRKYFKDADIIGYDINTRNIEKAKRNIKDPGIVFFTELKDVNKYGDYDIIFSMSVLCRWPETEKMLNCSGIYEYEQFKTQIEILDGLLKINGLLVVYNANFRFTDTEVAKRYEPVKIPKHEESGYVPKFSKRNEYLEDQNYIYSVFRKME